MNKRIGAIAGAATAAAAAAALVLPYANANSDAPPSPRAFAQQDAAKLGFTLASKLGENTAGWYYDGQADHLVVNVLDGKAAERVRAEGAVAKLVQNSLAELDSTTQTLDKSAAIPGTAWSIDPKTNKVAVIADRTVSGKKWETLKKVVTGLGGTASVERTDDEFKQFVRLDDGETDGGSETGGADDGGADAGTDGGADDGGTDAGTDGGSDDGGADAGTDGGADDGGTDAGTDGGSDDGGADAGTDGGADGGADGGGDGGGDGETTGLIGGQAIWSKDGGRCSLGFNVTADGAPAFLTAGHCTAHADTWAARPGGETVATEAKSEFPGSDYALVKYNDANTKPKSAVDLQNGTTQEITQAAEASVGMEVQRSGSTTGLHDGKVTALNATVHYKSGGTVKGAIQTDVCSESGDSGGPLFSGNSALGLLSGGGGDCDQGGRSFYQPVTKALEATGSELGGGDGGGGGADGGTNTGGTNTGGTNTGGTDTGGTDAGTNGGADDGGTDAGTDGGTDAGTDGGTDDGGTDEGTDGGTDEGTDGGTDDGGTDEGTDGGTDDGGTDEGTDGGSDDGGADDGGVDEGTDGGADDGGPLSATRAITPVAPLAPRR
ncbi:hypothetical protein GCM10012280_40000 [Wenjunlia tyrosinilytica]|uniref:Peptidase S1A alpha-lytic prodomain domain-containing protein n=1 Tax=Wenjunlia tyrosinilytica TaxID=1544741 RepID=A0A917ZTB6_9ACTN|nr:hypothetical protein GCM10012280_40000 [Wenjunlia tyrosinilytica]